MTSNIDIYRIANGLVKQHGTDATIHAAMLVDERLDDGWPAPLNRIQMFS